MFTWMLYSLLYTQHMLCMKKNPAAKWYTEFQLTDLNDEFKANMNTEYYTPKYAWIIEYLDNSVLATLVDEEWIDWRNGE